MQDGQGKRLVFGDFVDKLFWFLLICIGAWAGSQIKDLSTNVQNLNITMVEFSADMKAVKSDVLNTRQDIDKLDDRVRNIEIKQSKR